MIRDPRHAPPRPPRPGAPRGSGPGRRPGGPDGAARDAALARWELWNLRAFWPDAGWIDLAELKARRAAILAREREALAGLWAGDEGILSPGHGFLAATPGLTDGLVVSLHQGPYQLVLEIFLDAGLVPLVLASSRAREANRDRADRLARRLGCRDRLVWLDVARRDDLRRFLTGVRDPGQPVVAFLDGNLGAGGWGGSRHQGMPYRLPGRELRVRTGLARLAVRLGCPLHPVEVHWDEAGRPAWTRGAVVRAGRDDDPDAVARILWDWCFSQVMARPEQWRMWPMLRASAACFAAGAPDVDAVPTGLRDDYRRAFAACLDHNPDAVRLCLERDVEVWPGEVLVDLEGDRFFRADGLRDADLEPLRRGRPTLAELAAHHGPVWVQHHGLRLCLLGLARLGG